MENNKINIKKVFISKLDFKVRENTKFIESQKSNEKIILGLGKANDHEIKFTRVFKMSGPNFDYSAEANCIVNVDSSFDSAINEIKENKEPSKDNGELMQDLVDKCINLMFNKVNIYLGQLSMEVNDYPLMPELDENKN